MGLTCFTQEFTTMVAPSQMFKAFIVDSHNLIRKLVPQGSKSIEFIEGNGGAGVIRQTNFTEGGHFKYLKHRINALDIENLVYKYTLTEGDVIFDRVEKVVYEVKFETTGAGGCICKMTREYHAKGDVELRDEDIKQGKDKAMGLYKVVEEYLLANPNVYA
ncbi:pathogenesis-related protein STH-21-like [Punica granatum]|uniref:Pathogenesis-related protein STH-21-like n=1 Tax=Punica granatum TaxID=22663 RepID=A0A218WEA1_PUNGR|nr:pathogenesis-related protein STH-21-like [Punica granatum]OWM71167.1 hypothetical protein CDL15_Pgr011294 [Punica granatum]